MRTPQSVVYSCVADFAQRAPDRDAVERSEIALLADCDLVFALPAFVERCRRHSDRVVVDEPAVNMELFDPAADAPRPPSLAGLTSPVIGYVGGIKRNLDLRLLERLACERPDWTWVLVGPAYRPVDARAGLANVRLVGPLGHDELPGAIAPFDVCISPLLIDTYTESMVPTKFGEYLGMGKPIVSMPIPYAVALEHVGAGVVSTTRACRNALVGAADRGDVSRARRVRRSVA